MSETEKTTVGPVNTAPAEICTSGDGRVIVYARSSWVDLTPDNANAVATALQTAATLAEGQ